VLQQPGKDGSVVQNNAVGKQAATFRPEVLLILGFEAKLAETGIGNGTAQLLVVFAPVQGFLDVLRKSGLSI